MALFSECMQSCARKVLDTADIVRDRDITPTDWLWPANTGRIEKDECRNAERQQH